MPSLTPLSLSSQPISLNYSPPQAYGLLLLVHHEAAYFALFIIFPVARQVRAPCDLAVNSAVNWP